MEHKRIAIYGSTGSIGTQTLDVVRELNRRQPDLIEVTALACNNNVELLAKQIEEFKPKRAAVLREDKFADLVRLARHAGARTVLSCGSATVSVCTGNDVDMVVSAPVGIAGLRPMLEFIMDGKDVGLANKETLVTGGRIVMGLAQKNNVKVLPIDSEHSAIFQALQGNDGKEIEKIILTCSGGPFRGKKAKDLREVTVEQALGHPTWNMGRKITIDSSTLMNKGLEVIEATWLFGVGPERIEVVIHPQSVVHSAVQYKDGSVIAQLGTHDMRTPIQYAMTYPDRMENGFPRLDLLKLKRMDFEEPDYETFKCLDIAIRAIRRGGNSPAVVNGANEQAVELFLNKQIRFLEIAELVEGAFVNYTDGREVTVNSVLDADRWARRYVLESAKQSPEVGAHGAE